MRRFGHLDNLVLELLACTAVLKKLSPSYQIKVSYEVLNTHAVIVFGSIFLVAF